MKPYEALKRAEERQQKFEESAIVEPEEEHTHTAIILHGRGDCSGSFCADFLDLPLSDGDTPGYKLPGWRWVFPSSKSRWSSVFLESSPSWFEAHSLTDPTIRQHLQVDGIQESVEHILGVMDEEIELLGGDAKKLALGGISQGGAIAMWTLFCQRDPKKMPGALFVSRTWLPFAADIKDCFIKQELPQKDESKKPEEVEPRDAVLSMLAPFTQDSAQSALEKTPIFMAHDINDPYVDVELGRQAADVFSTGGWKVDWREYSENHDEEHWFKIPEEVDDICEFLEKSTMSHEVEDDLEDES